MRSKAMRSWLLLLTVLTLGAPCLGQEADFIRGDANGDGVVSFADEYRIVVFLLGTAPAPDCMRSADVNADGVVEWRDVYYLVNFLFGSNEPPALPFPSLGPDPAPTGEIDCLVYGGGTPLEDPAVELRLLDASVPGGADNRRATLRIAMSNTRAVVGFSGWIRIEGALFAGFGGSADEGDLTGTFAAVGARTYENTNILQFRLRTNAGVIEPGSDMPVLELYPCLDRQTAAGEYSLVLESAEIVDGESGRVIYPALGNGRLTVLSDVTTDYCGPDSPDPEPQASVTLIGGSTFPGESQEISLMIRSEVPTEGYSFSVDFDEDRLQGKEVEVVWQRSDGLPYDFQEFEINNNTDTPGNAGVDEGYVVGGVLFDFNSLDTMPANVDNVTSILRFQVSPTAAVGETEVRFLDGGLRGGIPTENAVMANGGVIETDFAGAVITIREALNVPFVRGDANSDGAFNIGDPIAILRFLFVPDGGALGCLDAADANDDGTLDIADPVSALSYLFARGAPLPFPFAACGEDPRTPSDTLTCVRFAPCRP